MNLGSTYRLQLNGFGFENACRLVPYLDALGIEVLYVSPLLAAAPGSTHGYDVVDPTRIDSELGGPEGLEQLLAELDRHGMRLLLDVVPNHMAASAANPWWWDVLRLGRTSRFARYFDIDWSEERVVLAVLAAPLAQVLDAGELSIEGSTIAYRDLRFPLAPHGGSGDLASVLDCQHYRLSYWRLGNSRASYRRFFDVDGLVGMRIEDPEVYEATHRLVVELASDERVAGVRVDHVDGLADPGAYLRRLRHDVPRDKVVVVEKIVARGERLPPQWPVDGMTGYEFADVAGGLLLDAEGVRRLAPGDFGAVAVVSKVEVLRTLFRGQVERLARDAIAAAGSGADISVHDMATAIVALSAQVPVYRTYLPSSGRSTLMMARARALAAARLDGESVRALCVIVEGMLGRDPEWAAVARRWEQLTGAAAAKGVEDTALYRFDGLVSTAEVGSDTGSPAIEVASFHRAMENRPRGALNATSTHDSKLGEDVRARLAVLSEMPVSWKRLVARWTHRHASALSLHDEHRMYQALAGTWPPRADYAVRLQDYAVRLQDYMVKAAREAKSDTSWIEPNDRYEQTLRAFVGHLLGRSQIGQAFRTDMDRLVKAIGPAGATNSLALAVLRTTAPGVPDLYQGNELWAPNLVDPDNRRQVDFGHRERVLGSLEGDLLGSWEDGRVKMAVVTRLLHLRRDQPHLFARGAYIPLSARGASRAHVVSFARNWQSAWALVVVPRHSYRLGGSGRFPIGERCWGDGILPLPANAPTAWREVLSGKDLEKPVRLATALEELPVAVLVPR